MTATGATRTAAGPWRPWPRSFTGLWRRSLSFRTISLTLLLTSVAIFITSAIMALVVQNDLFESRKEQVLDDALRATAATQQLLNSAEVVGDPVALQDLWRLVPDQIARISSSDSIAAFPLEDSTAASRLNPFTTGVFISMGSQRDELLSAQLRERVKNLSDRQAWQSIVLQGDGETQTPGIVVGQQLSVPEAGAVELYIVYDLADANGMLVFIQRVLWVAGFALVALIAIISWAVLRSVSKPIVDAADTSARLASGDLEVRLAVHGEDELAVLAASFNAMADSIESQIKELGELSLVQQRFVSDVSHELRTPLTTIRLAADMLNGQRDTFDATTARTTELLHTQVQRFETLLADLLEISRYDAGSVQLELEATSLAELAEDIADQMRPLAEGRGTELRLVAPGGYSYVDMDPRRVRRVLRNLIGNAIEHGEGRPVVITVDSNQHAVAVGVRDFGLGMSPADAERVFDRFWRADPSRQRTIGGTGLGLSIALGDARLHGGTLAVWSELGVGTNFVLTLPRAVGESVSVSPVALEPQDTLADLVGPTEPISLDYLATLQEAQERVSAEEEQGGEENR